MNVTEAGGIFDFIKRRRTAYLLAKSSGFDPKQPATQDMLIDLAKFCRAHETCVVLDNNGRVDNDMTKILEGRREVWLRIQNHMNLSSQQLFKLLTGEQFNPGE